MQALPHTLFDMVHLDMEKTTDIDFSKVRICESIIGYTFKKPLLLWQALPLKKNKKSSGSQWLGLSSSTIRSRKDDNHEEDRKRLADLGLSMLDLLLVERCYLDGNLETSTVFLVGQVLEADNKI